MYKYALLNNVSSKGTDLFDSDFTLTENAEDADFAIVRSAKMHDMKTENYLAIARAGSGTNNIPKERCAPEGVVVFNTPGANSNAVKELVLLGMLLSARDVVSGSEWVKTLGTMGEALPKEVEKGKSQFNGTEILNKRVAIVGMGAIGSMLANSLSCLGMDVCGYSPSFTKGIVPDGLKAKISSAESAQKAIEDADYVILALPLKDDTREMVNSEFLSHAKEGAVLLNFSRAELVDEDALEKALEEELLSKYVTDFTTARVLQMNNTLCLPHMGASTNEATDNCAQMAVSQIIDYARNGNIKNSVNYPDIDMGEKQGQRLSVLYFSDEQYSREIEKYLNDCNIEIKSLKSVSKNKRGVLLADLSEINESHVSYIRNMANVIRVRVL